MSGADDIPSVKVRHVLLAGATGEVGRRLVPALAALGSRLTLLGQSAATLAELARQADEAGARSLVIPCACLPADASGLVRRAVDRFGPIDCLVNAGAVGHCDRPGGGPDDAVAEMLQANLAAPIRLTQAVLPGMLRRRRGRIVNVGSVLGAVGLPGLTVYAASIFGLRGYSEALRRDLEGSGVSVAYVAPCHAHGAEEEDAAAAIALALGLDLDGPELAAAAAAAAVEAGDATCPAGWPGRLVGSLNAAFPGLIDRIVARRRRRIRVDAASPTGEPAAAEARPGAKAARVIPIHPREGA